MTTLLPAPLATGRITGHISAIVADTPIDGDTDPDVVAVPGLKITFRPSVARLVAASIKRILLPQAIVATFDNGTGMLSTGGLPSIDLVATDSDGVTPIDWTWTATVEGPGITSWSFPFSVPAGSTQDLSEIVPVATSNGTPVLRGPSPHEDWLAHGNTGTYEDFLATLEGATPTLVSGTTTTLAPEQPAEVTLVPLGDATYRVDAAVPGGSKGEPGAPGGSDPALATWIGTGEETKSALSAWLGEQEAHPDQVDLVDVVASLSPRYTAASFVKVAAGKYQCRLHDGKRGVTYGFVKDANDDFHKIDACYVGFGNALQSTLDVQLENTTGAWVTTTAESWYTTTPGAGFTMTAPVGANALSLRIVEHTRGGMWSISVDGGPSVKVSCWGAVSAGKTVPIAEGLDPSVTHTVVGTFTGDDPVNPPSSSPSRAYLRRADGGGTLLNYTQDAAPTTMVLADASNKEFAFTVTQDGVTNWIPDHNSVGTAWNIDPAEFVVDGVAVDVAGMSIGAAVPITDSFELRQHFYGRPNPAGVNAFEFNTTHHIDTKGLLEFSGQWTALADSTINTGYPLMLPAMEPTTNRFVTGIGSEQTNAKNEATTYFPAERDAVYSGAVVSPTNRNLIAAGTLTNPRVSYRRGQPDKPAPEQSLFLWHRATKPKLYWNAADAWDVSAGDSFEWGSRMMVGDIDRIYDVTTEIGVAGAATVQAKVDKSRLPLMMLDYCAGDGVTNDTANAQAAISAAIAQSRALYSPPGAKYLVDELTVSGGTLTLEGDFAFIARTLNQPAVFTVASQLNWGRASVSVDGNWKALYGVRGGGMQRSTFDHLNIDRCRIWGQQYNAAGNNNFIRYGKFTASGNGRKSTQTLTSTAQSANVSNNPAGFGTFTLSQPLAAEFVGPDIAYFVISNGLAYKIKSYTTTTIEVFNLVAAVGSTVAADIVIGGALNWPKWGDNGVSTFDGLDIKSNSGMGIHQASLYGHVYNNLVLQGNSIGIGCSDYSIETTITKPYFEANAVNYVSWAYISGTMTAPVIDVNTIQNCIGRLYGTPNYDPRMVVVQDAVYGLVSEIPPAVSPGAKTLVPGKSYAFHYNSDAAQAFTIDNATQYAAFGAFIIMVDLTHTAGAVSTLSLSLKLDNGQTVMGNAFSVPYTAKAAGQVLLKIIRVGTDWQVSLLRQDVATAISLAPTRIGQMAVVGGVGYVAVGVASAADWKQITT
jgi:hypothetical protein